MAQGILDGKHLIDKSVTLRKLADDVLAVIQPVTVIDNLTSTLTNAALSANQGRILKEMIDAIAGITVIDSLTSTSTTDALSANQGKVLNDTKQVLLVSGVNIKTVGGVSILGSGDIPISGGGTTIVDNLTSTATDSALSANQGRVLNTTKQDTLVSGTNIKTINSVSLLGSGNMTITDLGGATTNHTHQVLTLQVAGTTKVTYNGGTAVTFNVTATDLSVYTKSETYNKTEIDGKIPDNIVTVSHSTATSTGGNESFTLVTNRNIYKRISLNAASLTLVDSNPAADVTGGSILYSIKNTTAADAEVIFPTATGYEYLGEVSRISIPAGKSVEIGIVPFGASVRSLTYATMGFTPDIF